MKMNTLVAVVAKISLAVLIITTFKLAKVVIDMSAEITEKDIRIESLERNNKRWKQMFDESDIKKEFYNKIEIQRNQPESLNRLIREKKQLKDAGIEPIMPEVQ